ncbi:MAG: NAD-dependent epimerase/dehydratase family protein [Deltaproteobacteria bacterium]|nr:NAD-dependent epimerase/dehydratase family protein [Deltaproteobacteria bacterium]
MKILVTGGAGFIGSNVVDEYINRGHMVFVVDNLLTGKMRNLNPKAVFYRVDVRSEEIGEIMAKEKPDIVNHHAAQISVPASVEDPILDADINIKGLLNVLESSVKNHVKKVIFISSGGAIYGEAREYPTTESYQPRPLSPYAIAKFCSEYYLAYYKHQHGLEYTVLRYANVYGPRQIPNGEAGVVAIFMSNLLAGKQCVLNHFPEDPEGMTRDYCHVSDVARANILALERGDGDFFNIGTGKSTKTLRLFKTIYDAVRKIRPDFPEGLGDPVRQEARSGDLKQSCLAVAKAEKVLGWAPQVSLAEGIRTTLEWWRNG